MSDFLPALLAISLRLLLGFKPCDDALISFRFAYNLAHFGQLNYNLGDSVFGATSLSYTLALALLHSLGLSLPLASNLLTLCGEVVAATLLYKIGLELYQSRRGSLAIVLIWATHPLIAMNSIGGMETSIYIALLFAFVLSVVRKRLDAALPFTGLILWTRIDGVILLLVWLWLWFRAGRPKVASRHIAVTVSLLALYAFFTLNTYGTLIPESALAKATATRATLVGASAIAFSLVASISGFFSVWYWSPSLHIFLLAGLWKMLRHELFRMDEKEGILALLALAFSFPYILAGRLNTLLYPWYFVPFLSMLLPLLCARTARWLEHLRGEFRRKEAVASLSLLPLFAILLLPILASSLLSKPTAVHLLSGVLSMDIPENDRQVSSLARTISLSSLWLSALALAWLLHMRFYRTAHIRNNISSILVMSLFVANVAHPLQEDIIRYVQKYERRESFYIELGEWCEARLPSGAILGAEEIGALGWGAKNIRIYDELGLVTEGAFGRERVNWVEELKPALIVETSRTINARRPDEPPIGYITKRSEYNLVYLREDLDPIWKLYPPGRWLDSDAR